MPADKRLRTDDAENLQDRRKPSIELDEEQAIVLREPDPAAYLTSQHNQLMPERRILCFKADLRLEWRGQDRKHKA